MRTISRLAMVDLPPKRRLKKEVGLVWEKLESRADMDSKVYSLSVGRRICKMTVLSVESTGIELL